VRTITALLRDANLGHLICTTFDEAQFNDRRKNIVIIEDSDIYLTYKLNGVFGEFVCWVDAEFEDDENVYDAVVEWAKDLFRREDGEIDACILLGSFPFDFKPYK